MNAQAPDEIPPQPPTERAGAENVQQFAPAPPASPEAAGPATEAAIRAEEFGTAWSDVPPEERPAVRRRILDTLQKGWDATVSAGRAANNIYDRATFAVTPRFVLTAFAAGFDAMYAAIPAVHARLPLPGHAGGKTMTSAEQSHVMGHVLTGVKMLGSYALHQALGGVHLPVTPSSGAPDLLLSHHGTGAAAAAVQTPAPSGELPHAELMAVRADGLSSADLAQTHAATAGGVLEAVGTTPGGVRVLDEHALQHVHREWAKAGVPNEDFQFIPNKEGMTLQVVHPTDIMLQDGKPVTTAELHDAKFLVTIRVPGLDGQLVHEAVEIPTTIQHDPVHGNVIAADFPPEIAAFIQADKFSTIETVIPGHGSDITVLTTVVGAGHPVTPQDAAELISHTQRTYGLPDNPGKGTPGDGSKQGSPGDQGGGDAGGDRTQSPPASSAPATPAASSPAASPSPHPTAPATPSSGAVPPGGSHESSGPSPEDIALAVGVPVAALALALSGPRVARSINERRRARSATPRPAAVPDPTVTRIAPDPSYLNPGLRRSSTSSEQSPDDDEDIEDEDSTAQPGTGSRRPLITASLNDPSRGAPPAGTPPVVGPASPPSTRSGVSPTGKRGSRIRYAHNPVDERSEAPDNTPGQGENP